MILSNDILQLNNDNADQESTHFFCKDLDDKWVKLSWPQMVFVAYSLFSFLFF